MKEVRIWVVGLGTVGQWLLRAMHSQSPRLADRYGFVPKVVAVANARDGFVYGSSGLDPQTVLEFASAGRSLTELDGIRHWPTSAEGLAATEADVLVEVTPTGVRSPATGSGPKALHTAPATGVRSTMLHSPVWYKSNGLVLSGDELANNEDCNTRPDPCCKVGDGPLGR